MKVALILDNVVVEIKDIDPSAYSMTVMKYQAGIDITEMNPQPQEGWIFDGSQLVQPAGELISKKISKLALRNRFTMTEKVTLEAAAAQDNTNGYTLRAWISDFNVSQYVDLARPDTIAGVQFLEASGLIGPGRANQILNNPISDVERWRG